MSINKYPEIEKVKKLKLEQDKEELSNQEKSSSNENSDANKTYIDFRSRKSYKRVKKKEKIESKINHFNKYERSKHISTIEEVYNIAKNNEDLYKQIFHQFTFLFSVREIDIYEKKTSLKIVDEEGNLNPRLKDAPYLYPIVVGNNYEEYLQILKQNISNEQKLSKIRKKQIHETLIGVIILIIVVLLTIL